MSLPLDVLKLVEDKKITAGHAKILVGLENASFVASKILKKNLSVRQSEKFVKIFKVNKKKIINNKNANIRDLELSITEKVGLNVNITNQRNNKGKITFEYKSLDQLNKLIEVIKSNY